MASRIVFVGALSPLFFGFGAWAQSGGIIVGRVTDIITGESIFGARITDVTDEANEIPGSFADNGDYFIRGLPEGTRSVKVTAEGYIPDSRLVFVDAGQPATLDFELVFATSLNTAEITLLMDGPNESSLLPPIVEAVQNGTVVGRTFVRAGNQFRISGIPTGRTTFRSASAYYVVGTETFDFLSENETTTIILHVSVPAVRGPIQGSVGGIVTLSESPITAHVYATFQFEGSPVTVTSDSAPGTGVYQIDLLPAGSANVKAHAINTTHRSPPPPSSATTIVGGNVATKDLEVFPFDPLTLNFIPIVESPAGIAIAEDATRTLSILEFAVTDLDDGFPAAHTLAIQPGFNFTRSSILPVSTDITPDLDWNGSLAVPVVVNDGTNNSAPFILTVTVSPLDDATVYVDFEAGLPAGGGGTGGAANPFLTVGEARSAVSAGGTILIKGLTPSTEAPLTINQDVSLQNNNSGGQVVRIAPSGARQLPNRWFRAGAASPAKSGFVTRSGRPSPNHRSGT